MVARWTKHNPPPSLVLGDRREVLLDLNLRLITPMFGGGVTAGQPDLSLPARPSAIRGHLRFWWRACVAAASDSAERLFAEEAAIWGQAHRKGMAVAAPSAIDIEVAEVRCSEQALRPCQEKQQDSRGRWQHRWTTSEPADHRDPLGYVLWPFGESRQLPRPADALWDLAFRLRCFATPGTPDDRKDELAAALSAAAWAWVTFGGLGARTRRGCGALACETSGYHPPAGQDPGGWVRRQSALYVERGTRSLLVPAIHDARLLVGQQHAAPVAAWREAVMAMRDYRQGVGVGRNKGTRLPGRPGISRWPEPSSLRQQLDINDPGHPVADPDHLYYPRADLGLPILFQRMGARHDLTVTMAAKGNGTERLASPVILKPLALPDGRAVPLILLLNAPHVWDPNTPGVTLNTTTLVAKADLNDPAKSARVPPIHPELTARDGFMAFASQRLDAAVYTLQGSS